MDPKKPPTPPNRFFPLAALASSLERVAAETQDEELQRAARRARMRALGREPEPLEPDPGTPTEDSPK